MCLNGSVYTLYHLAHTMVLPYLIHRTHILNTVLTDHNIFDILLGEYLMQDLLVLGRNFIYDMPYLPTWMDLPSVFKIDKIQDDSVSTPYLTVCLYSN